MADHGTHRIPDAVFTFIEEKQGGFSPGYDVRDSHGREWKVKMGLESRTEVVASRIVWAVGFHQPPIYIPAPLETTGGPDPGTQEGGRFRPVLDSLDKGDDWSWPESVCRVEALSWPQAGRWFVVRDLGHTLSGCGSPSDVQ